MELKSLRLINFQCFEDSKEIPIHKMTIFIGENDSGKTAILRALKLFLDNKSISPDLFHKIGNEPEKRCEIKLTFNVEIGKRNDIPKDYVINNEFCLKKIFTLDDQNQVEQEILLNKYVFEKKELNDIESLKANPLKTLYKELGLENYTTADDVKKKIKEFIKENFDQLDKREEWYPIKWNQISEYLPIFEYYGSYDYGDPQKLIQNTLSSVYSSFFHDYDEEGNQTLKNELIKKKEKIITELNIKIEQELKEKVKNIIDKVERIAGDYSIDFAAGFQLSNITVDYGAGSRPINNIGEGSKKRLFLAILEWDKEIRTKESHKRVIRGYDEPDSSLHYSAQKQMFYTLKNLSEDKNVQVQPIICTHSLSLIDRAPGRIINHILHENGVSEVEYLKGDDDSEIKDFLDKVSEISGIKNSSIFFERCFLIVEGATEYNALPTLYTKCCGRRLSEDGVVLIDINGNGSSKNFLKLLGRNKSEATLMLLDTDTNTSGSKSNVTKKSLEEIGFDKEFLDTNIIFIGNKEFEDAFPNNIICRCLNTYWAKVGDQIWTEEEVEELRTSGKFSDSLKDMIGKYKTETNPDVDYLRKPEFGTKIANIIERDEIRKIETLNRLFDRINEIIR